MAIAICFDEVAGFGPAAPLQKMSAIGMTCQSSDDSTRSTLMSEKTLLSSRRSWISTAGLATSALLTQSVIPGIASAAETLETFKDEKLNFEIKVPSSWEKQVQSLPDRRKIILFLDPTSDKDKNLLFFAFTPVRDDFTSLSSFGSVDQVAQMTILPKAEMAGEENESKMIQAESKKNSYFFDYTAKTPGQPKTHFRTIFSLSSLPDSAGATLVTITAQAPEDKYSALKPLFDEIMDSYGKLK
jgi:hypothetical protein